MLDAGADPSVFHTPMPNGGRCSPLFMAVDHERLSIAKSLVAHGARVNAQNNQGSTALLR